MLSSKVGVNGKLARNVPEPSVTSVPEGPRQSRARIGGPASACRTFSFGVGSCSDIASAATAPAEVLVGRKRGGSHGRRSEIDRLLQGRVDHQHLLPG